MNTMPTQFPKHCACGRTYDVEGWDNLPAIRVTDSLWACVESRRCWCDAPLAVCIGELHAEDEETVDLTDEYTSAQQIADDIAEVLGEARCHSAS